MIVKKRKENTYLERYYKYCVAYIDLNQQEANSVVRGLETSLKQMDEFLFFNEAVQVMKNIHPQLLAKLVETFPQKKREFQGDVLQSKRVDTEQEGKTEPRKIVKTRAMKIAQVDIVNGNFGNK